MTTNGRTSLTSLCIRRPPISVCGIGPEPAEPGPGTAGGTTGIELLLSLSSPVRLHQPVPRPGAMRMNGSLRRRLVQALEGEAAVTPSRPRRHGHGDEDDLADLRVAHPGLAR